MDIKILKDVLENDFDEEVVSSLKFKYKENILEIQELEEKKEVLKEKIKDIYNSYGLKNCVSNLNEIDSINEILEKIDEISTINKNYSNWIKIYEQKKIENEKKYKNNEKANEYYDRIINNLKEDIALNKKTLKSFGTKKELNSKIDELYNNISQSMIIFDREEREQKDAIIIDVYIEKSNIIKKIIELEKANENIEKMAEYLNFVLPTLDKVVKLDNDEKIAEKIGVPEDKLDNIENIDIVREVVSENPEVFDEDKTWDETEDNELTISEVKPKEINVIDVSRPVEILENVETPDLIVDAPQEEQIKEQKNDENIETLEIDDIKEIQRNIQKQPVLKEELLDMKKDKKTEENVESDYNLFGQNFSTKEEYYNYYHTLENAINSKIPSVMDNSIPKEEKDKVTQEILEKYENSINNPSENRTSLLENVKDKIDNKINSVKEKMSEVNIQDMNINKNRLSFDELLMDYYNLSKEQLYALNEDEVIKMLADYFDEEPSKDLIMPDEQMIQKIADRLQLDIRLLNKLKVHEINEMIAKYNGLVVEQSPVEKMIDNMKNFKLIKNIGKLSKEVSEKLFNKVALGTVKAGEDLDLEEETRTR